jgi:hypothetical protein
MIATTIISSMRVKPCMFFFIADRTKQRTIQRQLLVTACSSWTKNVTRPGIGNPAAEKRHWSSVSMGGSVGAMSSSRSIPSLTRRYRSDRKLTLSNVAASCGRPLCARVRDSPRCARSRRAGARDRRPPRESSSWLGRDELGALHLGQVTDPDQRARGQGDRTLDHVLELADVARPGVATGLARRLARPATPAVLAALACSSARRAAAMSSGARAAAAADRRRR